MRRLTTFWLSSFITAIVAAGFSGAAHASSADQIAAPRPHSSTVMRLAYNANGRRPSSYADQLDDQSGTAEAREASRLRRAAEGGDAQAQCDLGVCYEVGRGVPKDAAAAVKWFRRAAAQGSGEAEYSLGCCYHGDDGFPRDQGEAVKWWGKAAAQGYADAQYCLGLSYFMGEGLAKDPAEAAKWWKSAAEQDHTDAQYFLGLSYAAGLGVPKLQDQAIYWLSKAADHGNENAGAALKKLRKSFDIQVKK